MLRVRLPWLLVLPATALLVVACGGGEPAPAGAGITRTTPAATAPAVSTAVAGAAGAAAATPVPADPALAAWGDAVCEATARFDDAVAAVQDGINPTTLALPERLDRARARYGAYRDALFEELLALDAIEVPAAAMPYHAALRTQVFELDRLFNAEIERLDRVVLASEIDAATAALEIEVGKLENSLALVRSLLPDGAIAALDAPVRCGEILG